MRQALGAVALWLAGCGGASPQATATSGPEAADGSGGEHAARSEPETRPIAGRAPTASERRTIGPFVETAERVRGLRFLREVPVRVQTGAEITDFVRGTMEPEPLERARRFYVALGMLPPDLDVETMLLSVMGEQIVGYYDPERDTMVVRDDILAGLGRRGGGPTEEAESAAVLVHEYVHALQDQHLGLSALLERERSIDEDNALASVVEGDATLAMIGTLTDAAGVPLRALTSDPSRLGALLDAGLGSPRGEALASAPPIVRVPLLSRYFDGLMMCATVHGAAGWSGVDGLHRAVPTTTEQVLHPERLARGEGGEPVTLPAMPELEAAGWTVLDEDTLGELELSVFLGRGADRDRAAGEGWGGDRVRVYVRGEAQAAVWFTSWDDEAEAVEAEQAMRRTPRAAERVRRAGRGVLFVAGLDDALAAIVESAFIGWSASLPPR